MAQPNDLPRAPIPLNRASLKQITNGIETPRYRLDVDKNSPTIVHISVGGFHRAHQALYLHNLLQQQSAENNANPAERYREIGVGLLSFDVPMRDAMKKQDCLYTLVERDATGETAKIIGSISEYFYAPENSEAVISAMADESCRIVSMTVTEGGYFVHEGTGDFDRQHPDIQHDLKTPEKPRTSFGYLLAALRRRKAANLPPFTVLSCDNMQENGHVVRKMLIAFARIADEQLGEWLAQNGAFPNCMVDRITPATTEVHRELVKNKFGIIDQWPVTCETFLQWVVEDAFPLGRPQWERVGVQLVKDVLPYELMKIRLLNASHQTMCYIGMLLGYRYTPEAMADKDITKIIRKQMDEEVTQLLLPVPVVDLEKYKSNLIERFANPAVNDQLLRIGSEGSARIPKFVLPCVRDALKKGSQLQCLAFTVASWIFYLGQEVDEKGEKLGFIDPLLQQLQPAARSAGKDAKPMLNMVAVFGNDLAAAPKFADQVQEILSSFYANGARATLQKYASS